MRLPDGGDLDLVRAAKQEVEVDLGTELLHRLDGPVLVGLALQEGVERPIRGEDGAVRVILAANRGDDLVRQGTTEGGLRCHGNAPFEGANNREPFPIYRF